MRPTTFSAIFLIVIFLCQQAYAATDDDKGEIQLEPFKFFSNLEYELVVNTDVTSNYKHYWGSVLITMKCIKKTNKMFLDQHAININDKTVKVWKYTKENGDEEITIHYCGNVGLEDGYQIELESYMQVNTIYKVRLEFLRPVGSRNYGFVYAPYRLKHPNVRGMLFTSMKKHYAHHVFPCFNKIGMKAKFKIKIGHLNKVNSFTNAKFVTSELLDYPKEKMSLLNGSNLEELKSTFNMKENVQITNDLPEIWVVDEFEKTDSISTFSVAVAVVDFNSYGLATLMIGPPDTDLSEVKVRVWAENDLLNDLHLKEVLRATARSLIFFSNFFDSTYNAGKLDVIVLSDDEITVEDSYGLIYLGEKVVKYVFADSTHYRADRYDLVSKICQASSRQWIGHFVSLSNWNDEWFYEGLRTYLQRRCILHLFDDWKIDVQLDLIDSFIHLLRVEERGQDYNPIVPLAVTRYFHKPLNAETKLKIHLIIRMLSFILELKKYLFKKILAIFIDEFQLSSLDLNQLWNSWTKTANAETDVQIFPTDANTDITISKLIMCWMHEIGYPLIIVSRNKDKHVITVTQKPFTFPGQNESERCWLVPFDIITKNLAMSSRGKMRKWLSCFNSPLEISVADAKEDDWIIVSLGFHVPGRVLYREVDSWLLIKKLFHNEQEISAIDNLTRIQLIHDMFTLAEASYLNYGFVFETMKYISNEKDYGCWHVFYHELNRLRLRWTGTSLFEPFQKLVRTIIEPIFVKEIITIEEFLKSGRSEKIVEQIIILTACIFELPDCEEYSQNLMENIITLAAREDFTEREKLIPELLRESFYCNAMKNADEKTWNFLLEKYKEAENTKILRALGCSKNPLILKKYLKWSIDVNNPDTSTQIGLQVFEILSSSSEGYQLIMKYFVRHRWGVFDNKKFVALTKFIDKFNGNIIIDDFLIKALKATNQQTYLKVLQKFSKTLRNRKPEKITMENEAISIARRTIYWFQKKAGKLSEYFSTT